jgi:hypothetical protein
VSKFYIGKEREMKTITIIVPIAVSGCGEYCDRSCYRETNHYLVKLCSHFKDPNGLPVAVGINAEDEFPRCRQCLAAERKAEDK